MKGASPSQQMQNLDYKGIPYSVDVMTLDGSWKIENAAVYSHVNGWLQVEGQTTLGPDHDARTWIPMDKVVITVRKC